MKKVVVIIAIIFISVSCRSTDEKSDIEILKKTESKEVMKAIDKDENGCLASAGYIWSKINKGCIKLFTGVQLNPVDKPQNADETVSAYLMFSENGNQAELFLPNAPKTFILTRISDGQPWTYQDWQLIAFNGFVLKKDGITLFVGDDFIGKKVLESDIEEK